MCDLVDGKLELLFAHLSINNIQHIQPLLIEAMDEYQAIRRSVSYEEKRNLNFVKTLLWHAERGEWAQARYRLHDAQKAYQEYISKKAVIMKLPFGYSQIHGKRQTEPYSTADKHLHEYMARKQHIDDSIKSLKGTKPLLAIEDDPKETECYESHDGKRSKTRLGNEGTAGNESTALQSRQGKRDDRGKSSYSSASTDEQGPTEQKLTQAFTNPNNKHSRYSKEQHLLPLSNERQMQEDSEEMTDMFRPTKIGDAFWRLYKTEWRHALDAIKHTGIKEERAIRCLYFIIQEAYQFCLLEAKSQVLEFENAALNIMTEGKYSQAQRNTLRNTGNIRHMVQYRNEVADVAVTRLQEIFLTRILPLIHRKYSVHINSATDNYARMCISVTWPMAVQDPPFQIVSKNQVQDDFDPSLYEPYKCGGNKVEYYVWPALRLYQNGPLLCRGVAQGKSTASH